MAERGEDLVSDLIGADDGDILGRRTFLEDIVVVMLYSVRGSSEETSDPWIGRWRRILRRFPLWGIVLEFALVGETGGRWHGFGGVSRVPRGGAATAR